MMATTKQNLKIGRIYLGTAPTTAGSFVQSNGKLVARSAGNNAGFRLITLGSPAPPKKLTAEQLETLKSIVDPYLKQVLVLQAELAKAQKNLADIAAAYLRGIGIPPQVRVNLDTGEITPDEAATLQTEPPPR